MFSLTSNTYLPPVITTPSSLVITAITQANPMVVTVSVNSVNEANIYIPGMAVVLYVPQTYGMFQANNQVGTILAVSGNNITLNIDSSRFDPFVVPASGQIQPAFLAPNGSRNLQYNNTNSSIVPFQNFSTTGN